MKRARERASARALSSPCSNACARVIIWLKVPRFSSFSLSLHGREYAGDLAAAAQDLLVIENDLGFHDARDGNLFALQSLHVLGILFRRDQFVVAAADKLQQVVQELGDIGGADVVLKAQFANAAAQIDPEIFIVEDTEILVDTLQHVEAGVVEGGGVHFPAANQLAHAVAHLLGGIDGVGQREDLVRLGVAFADQALDAVSQD